VFRFADPVHLLSLGLPLLALGYEVWRRRRGREPAIGYAGLPLFHGLRPTLWVRLRFLPEVLRLLALTAWCLALARPQVLEAPASQLVEGIDILIALDTSTSMRAADFQPRDRMHVAKKSVAEFIASRAHDRVGLLVFAGEAVSWTPLTLDYELLRELLAEVETGMLPDGTAIGTAIGTALSHLEESDAESKVVVLLTDGDNTKGNITPLQAADLAAQAGVSVYTIAIGEGGVVPYPETDVFGRRVYRKVDIPVDRELLQAISNRTGGQAFVAQDEAALDARLAQILDALDRSRLESGRVEAAYRDLFPWFGLFGALCLVLDGVLRWTRLRRLA
jgi:Ca-activated chloride channel family protein